MINLLHTAKCMYLMAKGIGFKNARFFSTWQMIFDTRLVSEFDLCGQDVVHIPTGRSLPVSCLHLVGHNLQSLHKVLLQNEAKAVGTKMQLQHHQPGGEKIMANMSHPINVGVFNEIFEAEVYDFTMNQPDLLVIDVGMNIGLAALYFATKSNVRKVIGYELIPETCRQAEDNIALNPIAMHKCSIYNIAWSNYEGSIDIPSQVAGSAHTSLSNTRHADTSEITGHSSVKVRQASIILKEIQSAYPNFPIVLKLDCEGEEYKILDDLEAAGLLSSITALLIEWHEQGKAKLVNQLKENGFSSFSPNGSTATEVGMIYAVKTH